ncbi:MAG: FKBP-type peptidyl-prolyl cis-trans isomerase [Planctomycetaceae bacterium]|nr:FKBP-type peptidyl-prolyl cis-trans isomerase [Phycisphaerales bacterium]MCE2652730.1 FKBP-type peptidyl-prolyl cis-trans isomerase [Planctomycetaceae bacterium]
MNTEKRDNGLLIEDLKLGEGYQVAAGGAVVAHYRGTLKADGTEFDSSLKRGQPIAFPLNGVIKGWQEGVPGMKVGGKRRLTIPAALAYGEKGVKDRSGKEVIPANADLVFEIELVNALEITDLTVGEGAEAKPSSTVVAHYKGTLKSDGTEFDSSYSRGEPATFPLNGVIRGWQWGVPGMKVGGKRKLIIPWQMAYGEQGSPPKIGPRADLVFEIELKEVK